MTVLNLQVSASADDGFTVVGAGFVASSNQLEQGWYIFAPANTFARFTGVSGLGGATVVNAYYEVYKLAQLASLPNTVVRADDSASPTAPTNEAQHNGKSRTTAGSANWTLTGANNSWIQSPSIVDVIQELCNSYDPTAIQILHDGPGSGPTSSDTVYINAYDADPSFAPKLHIEYTTNTPPTITVNPSVNYNGYTRTGPDNSPISVSFEAEDAEETGTDELTVEVRTAASGGGTLVATDDYTSGTSGSISIAHNASGLSEGSNTLYMRVGDGTDWSDDESFTLLVDRTDPADFTPSHTPDPVLADKEYQVTITANDSHSTASSELTVEVRTGAGGTGTLLWTGSRTASGTSFNTATITNDSGLAHGNNNRYVRVIDGAGNVREKTLVVAAQFVQTVAGMHIASTVTMHTPGVAPGAVDVGLQHIASTATLHTPAVAPGEVAIAANHIDSTATLYQPSVEAGPLGIGMQHIASTATTYTPGIEYDQSIAANHIASTATLHTPGTVYDQQVGIQHIAASTALYAPEVTPGSVSIGLQHIGSGIVLHTPGLLYDQVVAANHIASSVTLYQPSVGAGVIAVGLQHIGSTIALHTPAVEPGTAYVGMQHIAPTVVLYQPAVMPGGSAIGMQHIASTATLYLMTVRTGPKTTTILVSPIRRIPRPVLALYPPLAGLNAGELLDQISIDPQSSGLVLFSRIPGGFGEMTANIGPSLPRLDTATYSPWQSEDIRFQHFGHVELTDGDLTLFEGRMAQSRYVAGEVAWIRAMGYGRDALRDGEYESSSTSGTTSGQIIRQALSAAAPNVRPASGTLFIDPQVEHEPVEFDRMMPASILDQIAREGNDSGDLMDWAVWEGRRLHLLPRVAPSMPHYAIAAGDKRIVNMERDDSDLRGQVRVAYKDATSGDDKLTEWVSNPRFVDTYQLQRRITIPAGTMSATAADRMAQGYLRNYSTPRLAITIETSNDDTLPGPHGEPIPAYMARAGEWWLVGNVTLIALEVLQDWDSGRTRIQLGDESETFDAWLAWMNRDIEARQAGMNPRGGRAT